MDENYKIFVATIYGEAAGQSEASWKAIANVVMNRLEYGREWKKYKTPTEVIKGSGFDAYTSQNKPYKDAYKYLSGEDIQKNIKDKVDKLEKAVSAIYNKTDDDNSNGAVLYYSPRAQEQLYGHPPPWNWALLEEVRVQGVGDDDFKFFKYKKVAKYKISARKMDSVKSKKEVKISIDGKEKIVNTNDNGELPVLVTDLIGKKIIISIKNSKNKFVNVYDDVVKEVEVALDFFRNKTVANVGTKKHAGVPEEYNKKEHVVLSGQTLSKIAMMYNLSVSDLCSLNKIKDKNKLKIGQKLKISHKVKENKSSNSTEKKDEGKKENKVSLPKIEEKNKENKENEVYEGRDSSGNPRVVIGAVPMDGGAINGLLFPIKNSDRQSYKKGAGIFGYKRSGGRKHGGCDIYAPVGTPIRAVADGIVSSISDFYCETAQVTIAHNGFTVRYGEVDPKVKKVKPGDQVKRGDVIAVVGRLIMSGKPYKYSMLHFELYSSNKSEFKVPLTNRGNPPYMRRDDLLNPTPSLDAANDD